MEAQYCQNQLTKKLKLLRVGTVSVDGMKVDANENKRNNVRHDRAKELRGEIEPLLARAVQEDSEGASDPQALPQELTRHERLRDQLDRACAELERRARVAAAKERASYERGVSERERRSGRHKGAGIKAPKEEKDSKRHIT